jgi:hypothetical protein
MDDVKKTYREGEQQTRKHGARPTVTSAWPITSATWATS